VRGSRLTLAIAIVALLAGCGGGSKSGADASATVAPTTVSTAAPVATAPASSDTTLAGAPAPSDTAPATAPPTAAAPVAPAPVEPGAIPTARPGTYTFADTGSTKAPPCAGEQPAPPTSTVTVEAPAGSRQRVTHSDSGGAGSSALVLEFRADGVYLVSLSQTTPAFSADFEPASPVLAQPRSPSVGQMLHFVLTSTDGKLTADTTITFEALADQVTLGDGTTLSAIRAKTAAHVTGTSSLGPVNIDSDSEGWTAPAASMAVKAVDDVTGKIGVCNVQSHVESTLQSLTPA
jgi:hypothetical protein